MTHRKFLWLLPALLIITVVLIGQIAIPAQAQTRVAGAQAFYTFEEGTGNLVRDLSGNGLDMIIFDPGAVTWINGGGLTINGTTLLQSRRKTYNIRSAIQASGGSVTIEARIDPAADYQGNSPADNGGCSYIAPVSHIVALADNIYPGPHTTFSLEQTQTNFHARFATNITIGAPGTGYDGIPGGYGTGAGTACTGNAPFRTADGTTGGGLRHIVFTRDGATQTGRFYINGVEVSNTPWPGTFDQYFDMFLVMGNNIWPDDYRRFRGEYQLVAIYGRALTAAEVLQNYNAPYNGYAAPLGNGNAQPDADSDGFPDTVDECDNTVGTINGCPDTDGDRWHDGVDNCDNQFGTNQGCPVDTDGDSIFDHADDCRTLQGDLANNGCPAAAPGDGDGDGFADNVDQCPATPGTVNGCPADTDGDGFNDNADNCPNTPGPDAGCPTPPGVTPRSSSGAGNTTSTSNFAATAPLCDGTNGVVQRVRAQVPGGAVTNGSVFCNELTGDVNMSVGNLQVVDAGIIMAVDVFGLDLNGNPINTFNAAVKICLPGSGGIYFLDANQMPRQPQALPVSAENGMSCAMIPNAGTVVLVNSSTGTAAPSSAAAPASTGAVTDLTGAGCRVTTTNIVNLRQTAGMAGSVIEPVPYNTTLEVTGSVAGWWQVIFGANTGFISADFATTSGNCG